MQKFFNNPLFIWLFRVLSSILLELKYKKKHLKISGSSRAIACSFGEKNTIYPNVVLNEVKLGDFTYIAAGTQVSKTSIGKFCSIGPGSRMGLGKHPSSTFVSTHPIFFSTLKQAQITFVENDCYKEFEAISIANDVWVGANVIVLDGVNIANGVIVAAGSVVTKDVPPYAVIGGVPAKVIKYRFEKDEIDQLLEIKWWDKDIEYLKKNYKKFHNIKKFLE